MAAAPAATTWPCSCCAAACWNSGRGPGVDSQPASAALAGGVSASAVKHGGSAGTAVVALIGAAVAVGIVFVSRRNPVSARNVSDTHEVTICGMEPVRVGTAVWDGGRPREGQFTAMNLDRTALGQLAAVSLAVTVAAVFAHGVLGLARHERTREEGGGTSTVGLAQAGLCFVACAAMVAYGICLIVPLRRGLLAGQPLGRVLPPARQFHGT